MDHTAEEWESLEKVRLPLSLNFSQCMLELKQYQEVVELNSNVLKKNKGNMYKGYVNVRIEFKAGQTYFDIGRFTCVYVLFLFFTHLYFF